MLQCAWPVGCWMCIDAAVCQRQTCCTFDAILLDRSSANFTCTKRLSTCPWNCLLCCSAVGVQLLLAVRRNTACSGSQLPPMHLLT